MEPRGRYFLVGVGTVLLIVAAFAAVLWVKQGKGGDAQIHYLVLFRGVSLSGVQTDGLVTMRGIQVGRIKSLRISPHDIAQVEVDIAVRPDTPVREDTKAVIHTNILTGLSSIDLVGGSQSSPKLTRNTKAYDYPVIYQGTSELQAVTKSIPEAIAGFSSLAQRAGPVIDELGKVLSPENRERFSQILINIEKISRGFAKDSNSFSENIKTVSDSLKTLSDTLTEEVGKTSERVGSLTETTEDKIKEISQDIERIRNQIETTGKEFTPADKLLFGAPAESFGPGE